MGDRVNRWLPEWVSAPFARPTARLAKKYQACASADAPCATMIVEALEQRVLYSADLLPAGDDLTSAYVAPLSVNARTATTSTSTSEHSADASLSRRELVIVDGALENAQTLVQQILADTGPGRQFDVLSLDTATDGIAQISEYSDGAPRYQGWHLLSHGAAGTIQLGATTLDSTTALARGGEISAWADALGADADLLIYGCHVGADTPGAASLAQTLAALTGADVAASVDATGASHLGGDWELEVSHGAIETAIALSESVRDDFDAILATFTVTNANNGGANSLREAIGLANSTPGADVIDFDIGGAHPYVISLTTLLPQIAEQVTIDGTTEDNYAANGNRPVIVIDGNGLGGAGLRVSATADNTEIRGLVISDFAGAGIHVLPGANDVTIAGNFIGSVNTAGTDAGATEQNTGAGIFVQGAPTTVGGTNPGDGNVISGNAQGIIFSGTAANAGIVYGNFIGTTADGNSIIGNSGPGVFTDSGSNGHTIGGGNPGERNVIAGNGTGISLFGPGASNNVIQGNAIGVSADGSTSLGNTGTGISVVGGGDANIIGGTGNQGNWIGGAGIVGIDISGASDGTRILGNRIGTDTSGALNWGSWFSGIQLDGGVTNSVVGGAAPGAGNVVAYSSASGANVPGIRIASGATTTGNSLLGNSVYGGAGPGIDLDGGYSVTPNDAGDGDTGPNALQNFPVLASAVLTGADLAITGSLNTTPTTDYRVEFFATGTDVNSNSHGDLRTLLGFVAFTTDSAGNATFGTVINAAPVVAGVDRITAIATEYLGGPTFGNSSEPALNVLVNNAPVIGFGEGNKAYTENNAPVILDALATLTDPGSGNFDGGRLLVSITGNAAFGDQIAIRNEGSGAGQIGAGPALVTYGGVAIGSYINVGTALDVTLNANADAAAVQALMRNISFRSIVEDPSTLDRTVRFRVLDGDAGTSNDITKLVSVSGDSDLFVTTTDDTLDGNIASIDTLLADRGTDGEISLREAIHATNNQPGPNQIRFDISAALVNGAHTMAIATPLPWITGQVDIDARTEPDYAGTPVVELDGSGTAAGGTSYGLFFNLAGSGASVVRGLAINGFGNDGIVLNSSSGNTIASNYIGVDVGAAGLRQNLEHGIVIQGTSTSNLIGGPLPGDGNVISGNTLSGVYQVNGSAVTLQGNTIGLAPDGTTPLPNGEYGVRLQATTGAVVGGTSTNLRNVISTNGLTGIRISGTTGTIIQGNYIGTDSNGLVDADGPSAGTPQSGIILSAASTGTVIGGTAPNAGNLISGNNGYGVEISFAGTDNNTVQGNLIGTTASGLVPIGNSRGGISLFSGPSANLVGGDSAAARNVIGGNQSNGINVSGPGTSGNRIQGNLIGIASDASNIGNALSGVQVHNAAADNLIGGTNADEGNVIALNGLDGVGIRDTAGAGNSVLGNSAHNNGDLAIDIDLNGPLLNDAGDADTGANDLQNYPVIFTAGTDGPTTTVRGTLNSQASSTYRIEFFYPAAGGDASGYGEAAVIAGTTQVTTDAAGNASFDLTMATSAPVGDLISATATEVLNPAQVGVDDLLAYGSTSELAANVMVLDASPLVDLDPDVSSGAGGGSFNSSFAEGGPPAPVADADATVIDATSTQLQSLTVTLTNILDAGQEFLAADPTGTSISALYNSSTGVLNLSGADSVANYQQVLRTVTYDNTSAAPDPSFRVILVRATDGVNLSAARTSIMTLAPVNNDPVIAFGQGDQAYTENAAPTLIDTLATVNDVDSADFDGGQLSVAVTVNGQSGDLLQIRDEGSGVGQVGVSGANVTFGGVLVGSFTATAGMLDITFNASAHAGAVQAVTRNVTYQNTDQDPSTLSRTVRFTLSDGDGGNSTDIAKLISVTGDSDLYVTTSVDMADGDTTNINSLLANRGADGEISLREAIEAANNTPGPNQVRFNIAAPLVGGAHTISLATALPEITDTLELDASSEPDYAGIPVVELNGSALPAAVPGPAFFITTGGASSSVRGFAIAGFGEDAISLWNTADIRITGNWIGTDVSGTATRANLGTGIVAGGGTSNVRIGGPLAGDRNVIAGNASHGIHVDDVSGVVIEGNYIGIDASGNTLAGNGNDGIRTEATTAGVVIGGPDVNRRNVVTGNAAIGIHVRGTNGALIQGNYIGVDATGTTDLDGVAPQIARSGVKLTNGATGTVVQGNVLSGNNWYGIELGGTATSGNTVQDNLIGTDFTGNGPLGNAEGGVLLFNAANGNTIGGNNTAARNIVSGNVGDGVLITSTDTRENLVQGNWIGIALNDTALGNGQAGVEFRGLARDNLIGGTMPGVRNRIAYNTEDGIQVNASAGAGNTLVGNRVFSNLELGIDLGSDGVDTNDPGDTDSGANNLQNFPVLLAANTTGAQTIIRGSLNAAPLTTYYIDFVRAAGTGDPSGFGEGTADLGSTIATTDAAGDAFFAVVLPFPTTIGDLVTATASELTDPAQTGLNDRAAFGSTSEFGANIAVQGGTPSIDVNTGVSLNEGDAVVITNTVLHISDPDTAPDARRFTITTPPVNGALRLNTVPLTAGQSFTQDDIDNNRVDYVHNDSETSTDLFRFTFEDATSGPLGGPDTFGIALLAINDNEPQITSDGGGATATLALSENTAAVTTVVASDIDVPAQPLTFSIVPSNAGGAADAAQFSIDAGSGVLTFNLPPNFEAPGDANADNAYEVTINVSDGDGRSDDQMIAISIDDVNEAPDALSLSGGSGLALAGRMVGQISATDPDVNDSLSFSLTDNANGRFVINGTDGTLTTSATISGAAGTYTVNVQVTDSAGNAFARDFLVGLATPDDPAPTPVSQPAPAPDPVRAPDPLPSPEEQNVTNGKTGKINRGNADQANDLNAPGRQSGAAGTLFPGAFQTDASFDTQVPLHSPNIERDAIRRNNIAGSTAVPPDIVDQLLGQLVAEDNASAGFSEWLNELLAIRRGEVVFQIDGRSDVQSPAADEPDAAAFFSDPLKVSAAIVSTGAIWWVARTAGLLTSLLIGAPAWRTVNPLPIVMRERGDTEDAHDQAEEGEKQVDQLLSR